MPIKIGSQKSLNKERENQMKKILYSIGLPLVIIALLFSAIGCEGPVGPQGIQGIQGAAGATGPQGPQGVRGDTGEPGTGTSIVWMGTATSAPKSWRVLNYAYNSTHRTSYIWDGNSWEILARDGATGATGAAGPRGSTGAQGPAGPQGEPGPTGGYGDVLLSGVIERAAFRLLATQNNLGSWEWMNPDTDPTTLSASVNTLGVTAHGMLDCYNLLGSSRYLDASVLTYDQMVVNAASGDSKVYRMRGPDIPFLVELSETTGNPVYALFAKDRYDANLIEFGSLAVLVRDGRINRGEPGLISWDINLYVQGALALDRYFPEGGYDVQALAMVEVLYNSLYVGFDFDITNPSQDYYCLAVTGALEAFVTTNTHPAEVAPLTTALLGSQQPDGSFIGGSDGEFIQPTAYAVMALTKVGQDRAVVSAVNYLVGCQELNGGWQVDGAECTEVGSEVAQAIYDYIK